MRAILKRLYSPDIYNLESYIPPEEENFFSFTSYDRTVGW